jgi:hypothetical protein
VLEVVDFLLVASVPLVAQAPHEAHPHACWRLFKSKCTPNK